MSDQSRPPVIGYPVAGYPHHPPPGYDPVSHYRNYPTAGTSYLYAAPPPQDSHNNTHPHNADPQPTPFSRLIEAVLIASTLAACTICFILFFYHRPRDPELRVDSVTLANFNVSNDSMVSGNWDVRFTVRNPNGWVTLSYYNIEAIIFYRSDTLTETVVPPFFQAKKNETAVRATLAASSTYLAQRYVDEIKFNRTADGIVSFNVQVVARVRFKAGRFLAWRDTLKFYCRNLLVGVSDNNSTGGSLLRGATKCRIIDD